MSGNIYQFKGSTPFIGPGCFIAPNATVIGNVVLQGNVNVWFNTVVRGDEDKIVIGENSNIQDLCMLHVDSNTPLNIGKNVTIGHNAIIHGCTIGDSTLVGMGAIILNGASVGENSVVAAGSIITQGKKFQAGSLIMGAPAKLVRKLSDEEKDGYGNVFRHYINRKSDYLSDDSFKKMT